jgi:hypothetical protein
VGSPIPTRDLGVRDRPALMKHVRAEILRLSGAAEAGGSKLP